MSDHPKGSAPDADEAEDRIIWRPDLYKVLNRSSETVRRMMKSGRLPPPDVDLSLKTQGWKLSTLHAAGIRI